MPGAESRQWASWGEALALAVLTCGLALAAAELTPADSGLAALWPVNAPAIALLMTRPAQRWPLLLLGFSLAATLAGPPTGLTWRGSLTFAAANSAEVLVAAGLARLILRGTPDLTVPKDLIVFTLMIGIAGPVAGVGLGVLLFWIADSARFMALWRPWLLGDAMGNLAFGPLLLLALSGTVRPPVGAGEWRRLWPIGLAVLVAVGVFSQPLPTAYLLLAVTILVAFRLGTWGAALTVASIAVIGGWATLTGYGPFAAADDNRHVQLMMYQLMLATLAVCGLPTAAALAERERLTTQLADSEQRYRDLVDNMGDVVYSSDLEGRWLSLNPAWEQLTGQKVADSLGRNSFDFVHPDDHHLLMGAAREISSGGRRFVVRGVAPGGEIHVSILMHPVFDDAGMLIGTRGTLTDVTAQVEAEAALKRAAETDPLTGLANRRHLLTMAEVALAEGEGPLSFVLIDIDSFKAINDCHGHQRGDEVLVALANALRHLADGAHLCARIGGEEFALLLPGVDGERATWLGEQLRREVGRLPHAARVPPLPPFTISLGVAERQAGESVLNLMSRADAALYAAKAAGRDRVMRATG